MQNGRVLIVEDDPSIRMLTRTVLEGHGYQIFEAEDGPSALPAARDARPDAILLDVGLPGIDGCGVLALLMEDAELLDVPVVMVTAWAEPELVAKAMDRGAHDYIRKPFDIADLAARVDAAVSSHARDDAGLQSALELEIEDARHSGRPLSVVRVGLNSFDDVVGTHGQAVGDEVLRAAARRLAQRIGANDILGLWGDEEFIVIAP